MNLRILPLFSAALLVSSFLNVSGGEAAHAAEAPKPLPQPSIEAREVHLADLRQLTRGGENAEAYWTPDGVDLVLQSTHPPYACDQIFRLRADGQGDARLISTGKGRTTCSYTTADGQRVLYSTTHLSGPDCPPQPDRSQGYVWALYPQYEIVSVRPDGSDLVRLTDNGAYDAETTVCPKDGALIFTSTRDGDLDLYRMDAGGKNVRRLTDVPGYDGGAFFSPDCSKIVWRASRPKPGAELDDYKRLLGQNLVRPSKLEIWVAGADGLNARQVTYLDAASFAPSFTPSGNRILFSSNYGDPQGREFDIWAINVDGSGLERITWTPGFDGFPLFSPDGTRLAFSSNRNQGAPGETNVFVARWVEPPAAAAGQASDPATAPADRFLADVAWLADDAREGRGIGTAGLEASSKWLAARFKETGLEPAGENGGYFQAFDVQVAVEPRPATAVVLDGTPVARESFQPLSFSTNGDLTAETVVVGYGITAPDLGIDDYKGIDAKGKIAVVRRFVPGGEAFAKKENEQRYSDLRYKAWNARDHGALAVIVVDLPEGTVADEAALPAIGVSVAETMAGDAGLPVVVLKRAVGAALFGGETHRARVNLDLEHIAKPAANVVGVLRAGAADKLPGAVLVGAHYDHLGLGGNNSLNPSFHEAHNGADDNASGTAALLEVARRLTAQRQSLRRDVYLVAFAGEESGVLGSTAFTRHPTSGLKMADLAAMLNMDMVGRLRGNALSVFGTESAQEWEGLVPGLCERNGFACTLSGDGFGPSDHSPFYAAGVPVLHFFTGVHDDYHKPSDDVDKINAAGGAKVAALVTDAALQVAQAPRRLTFKNLPSPPAARGDVRSYGATLGSVPDYAGDGRPGVLLASVRAGGPAEKAGMQRGDLLVELSGKAIRDIHDMMYVLQRSKPGEQSTAVVVRDGKNVTLDVVFGSRPQ